jgi:putative nucleotidyltransferase with HDIG domain
MLTDLIRRDPVVTARVLSLANQAASRTRHIAAVHDIYTATSLIGIGQVREIAVISTLVEYLETFARSRTATTFWQHCVAVGICAHELALFIRRPISADMALVAGLLHDIGQLWLYRFQPEDFRRAMGRALSDLQGLETVEQEMFGVDHSTIGAWLAEAWQLPTPIVESVRLHHAPEGHAEHLVIPVIHVAEVLSNALDLASREDNRVTSISAEAVASIELRLDASIQPLFGRIEARSRHALASFK